MLILLIDVIVAKQIKDKTWVSVPQMTSLPVENCFATERCIALNPEVLIFVNCEVSFDPFINPMPSFLDLWLCWEAM